MKKIIFIFLVLLQFNFSYGQSTFKVSGSVLDSSTREPLALASVFCQNTTIGTTSNKEGLFSLTLKEGGYDLIITYTGYKTQLLRISPDITTTELLIELVKEEKSIEEVIIRSSNEVKDGWEKHGQFFLDNFIGTTPFSAQCSLLNPEALKFYFFRRANKLKVMAEEPLIIANHALGYDLRYHLDSLVFDYNSDICSYLGFSFYQEMTGRFNSVREWKKNREKAYYGSRLHFMHSYFDSSVSENGFVMALLDKEDETKFNKISNPYAEEFFYSVDTIDEKEFIYPRRISITYTKSHPENEYLKKYNLPISIGVQTSYADMKEVIAIKRNGYYYEQKNWINYGYWSWKNIADQVPIDYLPN